MTENIAPFIAEDSDTARHLDHITVQVASDRARYTLNASQDSLQEDRSLGHTRVPTPCQQAALALVGTLVHHRLASVRAETTRMFWEIAGAHGIRPEVHYPVSEFATLAWGQLVQLHTGGPGCLGAGDLQPHRVPQGAPRPAVVTPRQFCHAAYRQAATLRHMPLDGAAHDALARAPRAAPPLSRQRRPVAGGAAGVPQLVCG